MFILRLLVLLIVVITLLWLLKRLFSSAPQQSAEQQPPGVENMRQCKYCGVHVPESTIVTMHDESYCCQEHADLDQQ